MHVQCVQYLLSRSSSWSFSGFILPRPEPELEVELNPELDPESPWLLLLPLLFSLSGDRIGFGLLIGNKRGDCDVVAVLEGETESKEDEGDEEKEDDEGEDVVEEGRGRGKGGGGGMRLDWKDDMSLLGRWDGWAGDSVGCVGKVVMPETEVGTEEEWCEDRDEDEEDEEWEEEEEEPNLILCFFPSVPI